MITLTMDDILTRNDLPVAAPLELQGVRLFEAYQYRVSTEGDEDYDPAVVVLLETSKALDHIWYEPIPELWQPIFEQVTAVQTARKQQKLGTYDGGHWYVVTICTHCKERMVAEDKRAKFCSNRCQRERKRAMTALWVKEHRRSKNLAAKVCKQCGSTFSAKRSDAVLCGAACRKRAQRSRVSVYEHPS